MKIMEMNVIGCLNIISFDICRESFLNVFPSLAKLLLNKFSLRPFFIVLYKVWNWANGVYWKIRLHWNAIMCIINISINIYDWNITTWLFVWPLTLPFCVWGLHKSKITLYALTVPFHFYYEFRNASKHGMNLVSAELCKLCVLWISKVYRHVQNVEPKWFIFLLQIVSKGCFGNLPRFSSVVLEN